MSQQPRDLRKEYRAPFAIFSREEGSVYKSLLSRDFNPPRSLDLSLIENLDVRKSVEAHCRTLGLGKAVEMRHDAYEELMLEFYTTFDFTHEDGDAPQFSCRLTGRNVTVTCKTLRDIFGFRKGGHRAVPSHFDPAKFWKEITSVGDCDFKNGKAPSGLIKDPVLLHVHRYVSHVLSGRVDSSKVAGKDLFYLSCLRRRVPVSTPCFLISTFNSVVTNKRANMCLGNFITAIALHFGAFDPAGMKVLPARPLRFKNKPSSSSSSEEPEDPNNLALTVVDQSVGPWKLVRMKGSVEARFEKLRLEKLESDKAAEKYKTRLQKCLLRIKKTEEGRNKGSSLVDDDATVEVGFTSNSSKGVSKKGVEYRGVKSVPSQIGNSDDHVSRMTALANRKKEAAAHKQMASGAKKQSSLVVHVPILSGEVTDPQATPSPGDLGSKKSKRPLVPVCEETEYLAHEDQTLQMKRLKSVPKRPIAIPGKFSVPILGLDDDLVSKYHDSEPNLPVPLARFLCAKSSSFSSDLPTSLRTALDSLPRAWTVGLEGILKNPRHTRLMSALLSSRLAVLNQAILSQQESQAEEALAASQQECFLLRSEKSAKDLTMEGFLAEISGLKDKLLTSVAEEERMKAKFIALETEKNELLGKLSAAEVIGELRVKDKENDELRAELDCLREEKLMMESDPMQSLQNFSVYTYYLSFFDSARALLQAGQSADVILNEIRDYTLKTPLHAGFLLPVLDLEVDYKVDLSWWPDRDQLMSPLTDENPPLL